MLRQQAAGIYSLPAAGASRAQQGQAIVREEQNRSGAIEMLMPTIQPADLWRESGRYDDYGKEMLRIEDRHERDMLYGPTNEEMITEIFRAYVRSYKDLPLNLYHIQLEVPGRGAAAVRADARPRIPDEGRLFVRHRPGRRAALLQQDVRGLSAHLRAARAEIDPDGRRHRPDRRQPQPRVHHPGLDRRVRGVLPQGLSGFPGAGRRRELRRRGGAAGRSSTSGPRSTPRRRRSTTPRRLDRSPPTSRCRRAASRSAISSISAPNIPSR